jgi:hypothetical protein
MIVDAGIVVASVLVALAIVESGIIIKMIALAQGFQIMGSFISGLFFTSAFTTAPAIVALGEIARVSPIVAVAFFGALGAVVGDLIIFTFIRGRVATHVTNLIRMKKSGLKTTLSHHAAFYKWFTFFVGGVILASPLPDELGIGLMGFTNVSMRIFVPVSFAFNFAGIALIGLVANAV